MTTYNRFTIQILGTVDAVDSLTLHSELVEALKNVQKMTIKAVNLDMWADGYTGKTREFDENGNELSGGTERVAETTEQETEKVDIVVDEATDVTAQ